MNFGDVIWVNDKCDTMEHRIPNLSFVCHHSIVNFCVSYR